MSAKIDFSKEAQFDKIKQVHIGEHTAGDLMVAAAMFGDQESVVQIAQLARVQMNTIIDDVYTGQISGPT